MTFPPEQQAPTAANLGCDLAQQCRGCSRPVVTITSKKAKLQTCEPASPHPYQPSWWHLVWRHLRWQPLVTKRQHWRLTGPEPNSPPQGGTETEETQTRRGHQTPWETRGIFHDRQRCPEVPGASRAGKRTKTCNTAPSSGKQEKDLYLSTCRIVSKTVPRSSPTCVTRQRTTHPSSTMKNHSNKVAQKEKSLETNSKTTEDYNLNDRIQDCNYEKTQAVQ